MPELSAGAVTIYAERRGTGEPLLVINGTGTRLAEPPSGFDLPFAAGFDTICYDQRGLGRSAGPGPGDRWSMADYADDAAAVLDWAGWDTAAIVGISFGGMVAQELMIRHPHRVSRAVLCCTSSGGAGASSYPLHDLADLSAAQRAALMLAVIDTRWADPDSRDPLRAYLAGVLERQPAADAGARAQLEARRGHDSWDRLTGIATPVFVCAGRYDGLAPLANCEALAARIPGAWLGVFDGGHGFLYQDPTAAEAIREFLTVDPTATIAR